MFYIPSKNAIIVAISGGSGSGKTTIAHQLRDHLQHSVKSVILYQDNYYKQQDDLPLHRRAAVNYDQPAAFDWPKMKHDLENLRNRKAIDSPVYDFTNHTRSKQTEHIDPVDVVIFEGFMSLHQNVLAYSDIRLFVDTPSDERLLRRMVRDINERGRDFDSIAAQWRSTVRPMYRAHVAPQKESAHIIVPWYEISSVAIKAIKGSILDFVHAPSDGKPHAPPVANVGSTVEGSAYAGDTLIDPSLKKPAGTPVHQQQQRQPQRQQQPPRQTQQPKPNPHNSHQEPAKPQPASASLAPGSRQPARQQQQVQPQRQNQNQPRPARQQQQQPRQQGQGQNRPPRPQQGNAGQNRQPAKGPNPARQQQPASVKPEAPKNEDKQEEF